ncbi:hypothetical protein [Ensifer sp. SSB1]|jgi:hypothetical protein|uniref:hypothetical protein n=1 Tax=Ensifer sp. SSB1 TaxID=2795385 RepID=UPI0013AFF91A|nr:hypothetical protein [Ensifer sp. SSB1]MBK5565039.1 hypothetical protein [Ensifer sp. SSB1]
MNRYKCAYPILKPISSRENQPNREGPENPQTELFARKRHHFEENSSSKHPGIGVLYAQIADLLCDCPLNPDDGPGQKKDGKSR